MGIGLEAKQEAGLRGRVGKQEASRALMKRWPSWVWEAGLAGAGLADNSLSPSCAGSLFPACPLPATLPGSPRLLLTETAPSPSLCPSVWLPVAAPLENHGASQASAATCPPSPPHPFGFHHLLSMAPPWDPTHPPACSSLNDLYLSQPLQFFLRPPRPLIAVLPPQIASRGTLLHLLNLPKCLPGAGHAPNTATAGELITWPECWRLEGSGQAPCSISSYMAGVPRRQPLRKGLGS